MTATPSKWLGREAPSRLSVSAPPTWTLVAKPSGYISSAVGSEDDRDARLLQEAQVAGLVARVRREVLAAAELRGVDEDGGGDARAARLRRLDQAEVAGVQGAHGRHEAEGARELAQRRPRLRDGPGDDHGWPPAQWLPAGAEPSGPAGRRPGPEQLVQRRHLLVVEPRRRQGEGLQAERAVRARQPRALTVEQPEVRAHRADVAAGDRPGERERRLAAPQQVLHRRAEQRAQVVEPARVAGGLVHQALGLALERDQQVAADDGREVVQRLLLVGQAERAACPAGRRAPRRAAGRAPRAP